MRPLIYGHRGASAAAPENTVAAFALARQLGADGVELDVRRSADGALVLAHDAALPDGRVVRETLRSALPPSMPLLAEALEECLGLVVNVEIKNLPRDPDFDELCAVADEVVAALEDRGGCDDVIVSSFHLPTIDRIKALAPGLRTGLLTFLDPLPAVGVSVAAERGHDALHPYDLTVDAALVDAAHEAGLAVNVWTVDASERIAALADLGVDGVVTNVPDVARAVLDARS